MPKYHVFTTAILQWVNIEIISKRVRSFQNLVIHKFVYDSCGEYQEDTNHWWMIFLPPVTAVTIVFWIKLAGNTFGFEAVPNFWEMISADLTINAPGPLKYFETNLSSVISFKHDKFCINVRVLSIQKRLIWNRIPVRIWM